MTAVTLSEPEFGVKPQVHLQFMFGSFSGTDYGHLYTKFEFKAMVNGGYIIRATLVDVNFNLLNAFIKEGYFKEARQNPIPIRFQIVAQDKAPYPSSATKPQTAVLAELRVVTKSSSAAYLEFVAIDPPSWFLNKGKASGQVYKGRVDQVIRQVVNEYAPSINLDVGKTTDNAKNKWWMMRQDPKTFISSLIDWSSSITQRKTQWLIESDGYDMVIKEQAAIQSRQRAFYRYLFGNKQSTISGVSLLANNALSIVQTKIITAGLGITSGQYLDRIVDNSERQVFVSDKNTSAKQIARSNDEQSFTKPLDDTTSQAGCSQIMAIPEVYSAGDLGLRYNDYIDGRPRSMWLNMVNSLLRAKFTVVGHGEWSECRGLGVDTIFIKWTSNAEQFFDGSGQFWWVTGNWLVYGFKHIVTLKGWTTDIYCARFDYNSNAKKIGGG